MDRRRLGAPKGECRKALRRPVAGTGPEAEAEEEGGVRRGAGHEQLLQPAEHQPPC